MFANIIKTEWLKVKHYRTFWILLGLFFLASFGVTYIAIELMKTARDKSSGIFNLSPFDFPAVWRTISFLNSYITLLLGFLVVILVSNEYTFRTHRQNIIDGWSRQQFALSKTFWIVGLSVFAVVVTFITALVYGAIYGQLGFSLQDSQYLFYLLLQALLTLSIAGLLAVLMRRAGVTIVVYMVYVMMENLPVSLIDRFLGSWGRLFPLETADRLMGYPLLEKMLPDDKGFPPAVYIGFAVAYILLFNFFINRKLAKSDL